MGNHWGSPRPSGHELPRAFWFLWIGTFVNRLGYFVGPFLTLYLVREQGLALTEAGTVVAAFGLGSLLSQPIGGWLADSVGRRRVLVASMVGTAAAYLALGGATTAPTLILCAFAAGLATDAYRPAVAAMVADLIAPSGRRRAYGLLYWAINVGVGVASVAGGALAERNFGLLFVLNAVACLAFAAVVGLAVPETRPRSAATRRAGLPRDPLLLALIASGFGAAVVYLQWIVALPLVMRDDGFDASAFGLVAAVNPAVIVALQPVLMRVLRSVPVIRVYATSGVFAGIGFGLTGLADSLLGYALSVGVWTLGEIALSITAPVILAAIAPHHLRGTYQGAWGLSWGLAMFVAPLAGTAALRHLGPQPLWLGCLVVASGATLILGLAGGALRRRAAAVTEEETGDGSTGV